MKTPKPVPDILLIRDKYSNFIEKKNIKKLIIFFHRRNKIRNNYRLPSKISQKI